MGSYPRSSAKIHARIQDVEQESCSKITRSRTFWFDDGSVVLQVTNIQYRVHRSTLTRHSDTFRNMFKTQKLLKPDATVYVEGCPVVVLADRPEDVEHMLSVFYDSIRVHDLREQLDVEYLRATLRLGKKYEIDYFKEEGLRRLRSEFPSTLEGWDCRNARKNEGRKIIDINDADIVIEVINLAHELSLETILPAAYLLCVQTTDIEEIIDGSINTCLPAFETTEITTPSLPPSLHPNALKEYLTGRNRLLCEVHKIVVGLFCSTDIFSGTGCLNPPECATRKWETIASLRTVKNFDYVSALDEAKVLGNAPVCRVCRSSLERNMHQTRQEMWENLPLMFGLPQWGELEDFGGLE